MGILLSYYGGWALGWLPQPVVWLIVLLLLVLALGESGSSFWRCAMLRRASRWVGRIVFLRQFRTFDLYLRLGPGTRHDRAWDGQLSQPSR
ncbi:MAG: hypothetical protein KatS3mg061_2989 [Dehalococcoidia bacterium]|nr:MAG: hypothetical protein KatS3mg061_2989 [Dehalococcoidia bacterium]